MIHITEFSQKSGANLLSQAVKYLLITAALSLVGFVFAMILGWMIDNYGFPGCKVVAYDHPTKTVSIELDPEYTTGSDGACHMAARIIYNITQQGYRVRVTNWHAPQIFTNDRAVAALEGGPY